MLAVSADTPQPIISEGKGTPGRFGPIRAHLLKHLPTHPGNGLAPASSQIVEGQACSRPQGDVKWPLRGTPQSGHLAGRFGLAFLPAWMVDGWSRNLKLTLTQAQARVLPSPAQVGWPDAVSLWIPKAQRSWKRWERNWSVVFRLISSGLGLPVGAFQINPFFL